MIALAPMEGLADYLLRRLLTQVGGYDFLVSEFIRVTDSVLPRKTFFRMCGELEHGSQTLSGTSVIVQLLGSDPQRLAQNAARLSSLAPHGIDLNFGCPAKTVNRHGGGAMLLADPERMFQIVSAVRAAMPEHLPLSAKMRLGISDKSLAMDAAQAIAAGGAARLVVHARTRDEGYKPPAHWEWIAKIQSSIHIPVMANGEIWTPQDYRRCVAESGLTAVMLGRGAVADPFLALRIQGLASETPTPDEWRWVLVWLTEYWEAAQAATRPAYASGRLKSWLNWVRRTWSEGEELFQALRLLRDHAAVSRVLADARLQFAVDGEP